jgi:hypothetical protein
MQIRRAPGGIDECNWYSIASAGGRNVGVRTRTCKIVAACGIERDKGDPIVSIAIGNIVLGYERTCAVLQITPITTINSVVVGIDRRGVAAVTVNTGISSATTDEPVNNVVPDTKNG